MSLFFFRLTPPRADFAQTMTPEEQQAMAAHQEYWQQLLADGHVVVYGPVADPEGVWGLGVLRAPKSLLALEFVAQPADRHQVHRARGVGLDLRPQPLHMYIKGFRVTDV